MCGIAGIWGNPDKKKLKSMLDIIDHRGPDGKGRFVNNNFALGHNRLSIIDVLGGGQPISNEKGDKVLIFNGEIYNFKELRPLLKNHNFKTDTDSEVVLHLYEEFGPGAVKKLDGMFAFTILDGDEIFIARDPLGIKPLYYGYDKTKKDFYFSSEIKSLLKVTEDINEFPAGYHYHSNTGFGKYYELEDKKDFIDNMSFLLSVIPDKLEAAVKKRLMSDVPLGVFLSGGLDSSIISAIARKNTTGMLHSFAVGTPGSKDLKYSKELSRFIGTEHHVFEFGKKDILDVLPEVIYHLESYDPALVRSSIPTFFVSRLASDFVKVVLSGEGADEIFGGYHYLKKIHDDDYLDVHDELLNITRNLHNTNLQRADRLTMANSIEGRVPFLDIDLVSSAFKVSPELKLYTEGNKKDLTEKWILRKIAERYLPKSHIWRKKEKFAIGTGTAQILEEHAEKMVTDKDLEKTLDSKYLGISSKEELYYYNIFKEFYNVKKVTDSVGKSRSLNPGQIYS